MMMTNLQKELSRDYRNNKWEETESGIYFPKSKLVVGGVFGNEVWHNGELKYGYEESNNIIVNEGLNNILDVYLHGSSQTATWYIGIFEGNYDPQATDTAANITANSTECTAYDETTRVAYVEAAASSQSTTNSASKATFTMNDTKTVYGAFLVSVSTKSSTSGVLCAASAFSAARALVSGDELLVTYTVSASST